MVENDGWIENALTAIMDDDPYKCTQTDDCACWVCSQLGNVWTEVPNPDEIVSKRPLKVLKPMIVESLQEQHVQEQIQVEAQHVQEQTQDCFKNSEQPSTPPKSGANKQNEVEHEEHEDAPKTKKPRMRCRGKQTDPEVVALGMAMLVPTPLRLPLVFGCVLAALANCDRMCSSLGVVAPPLDCVESFSGAGQIWRAFNRMGMRAEGFDYVDDPIQDFNLPEVFLICLRKLRRLKNGGLSHWGIPCCSWICTNLGTSGRSELNPEGRQRYASVDTANVQANRLALLFLFCLISGIAWLVEQPLSSLLMLMPRLAKILLSIKHIFLTTYLGAFGGDTLKPIKLWGTETWMYRLRRDIKDIPTKEREAMMERSKANVVEGVNDKGEKTWTGTEMLTETQTYPQEFGETVASLYKRYQKPKSIDVDAFAGYDCEDFWHDGRLEEIFTYIRDLELSDDD